MHGLFSICTVVTCPRHPAHIPAGRCRVFVPSCLFICTPGLSAFHIFWRLLRILNRLSSCLYVSYAFILSLYMSMHTSLLSAPLPSPLPGSMEGFHLSEHIEVRTPSFRLPDCPHPAGLPPGDLKEMPGSGDMLPSPRHVPSDQSTLT